MKKVIVAAMLSASLLAPTAAQAFSWGRITDYTLGNVLSDVIYGAIRGDIFGPGDGKSKVDTTTAKGKWQKVGTSSGGDIYYNLKNMDSSTEGGRTVTVEMGNFFSDAGSAALKKAAGSRVRMSDTIAYSVYTVVFGETDCHVKGKVKYYDDSGNLVLSTSAENALTDITSSGYGHAYKSGSLEKKLKDDLFAMAFDDTAQPVDQDIFKARPADDSEGTVANNTNTTSADPNLEKAGQLISDALGTK